MQELQVFNYESKEIRTIEINGNLWWVAKDVCDVLELENVSQALSRLNEKEKNTIILNEGIGNPERSIVNESGLYRLIFESRKPEAEKFKDWVFEVVLPSIRKTGSYAIAKNELITTEIQSLNEKLNYMSKEMTNLRKLVSGKKQPRSLEEIKTFFNVVDYSDRQEYIIVEYCNKLFLINNENYFTLFMKYKTDDNVWENNWRIVNFKLGSLKKGLEFILEMY